MIDDIPLFDMPIPTVRRAETLRGSAGKAAAPRWVRLRLKNRVPCDECIAVLHENNGLGPYAGSARWKLHRGTQALYLCHAHADLWRKELENKK